MKIVRIFLGTTMFLVALAAIHYVHFTYIPVDVVFYAAIGDAILASGATLIILFMAPYFSVLNKIEKSELAVIWLLMGYSFAISIPTVIDRSLSFYILEKLEQRGGGIMQSRMKDVFTQEYLQEHRLVDVRLTEQLQSGTILIENGCVKLTPKGKRIASLSRFYRQHFLPKKRLLMGQYTDDLTNPFRNSKTVSDYECR